MKISSFFARIVGGGLRRITELLALRLRNHFYLYLAAVISVLAVADAFTLRSVVDMRHKAYDMMVRYRIVQPAADNQIVIVDKQNLFGVFHGSVSYSAVDEPNAAAATPSSVPIRCDFPQPPDCQAGVCICTVA